MTSRLNQKNGISVFYSKLSEKIKSYDMFGMNLGLSFKGEKTFNTCLGSLVTFMILGLFLAYTGYKGNVMI
jgi:hypothetical protein